jgi:phosphatidylserine synthase
VNEVSEATWRRRFILVNLVTIGGTILGLFGILMWQTDYIVEGGSAIGFALGMIGLVISFFAPRFMASRWKRGGDA